MSHLVCTALWVVSLGRVSGVGWQLTEALEGVGSEEYVADVTAAQEENIGISSLWMIPHQVHRWGVPESVEERQVVGNRGVEHGDGMARLAPQG